CVSFCSFLASSQPVPSTLSLHDALPIFAQCAMCGAAAASSRGVARGLAFSIFFLLGTLFLVVGWLVVLVLRTQALARKTSDAARSEEHTSELQSRFDLVCRLLLGKKNSA